MHLKRHKSTEDMTCPEDGCNKVFASFSRFNSHVQKKHSSCSDLSSLSNSKLSDGGHFENSQIVLNLKSQDFQIPSSSSYSATANSEVRIKKEESKFTTSCSQSSPNKKPVTSSSLSQNTANQHVLDPSASSSNVFADPEAPVLYHQHINESTSSVKNESSINVETTPTDEVDPCSSFQPQYTEARFNYTSSSDSTLTETLSTSNPSDILSLLHQSFFTIDDSEASLKLLSFLATQGNLQIFNQDNQDDLPSQHTDFLEQTKHQQQTTNGDTPFKSVPNPNFSLFSNVVPSTLDPSSHSICQPLNPIQQNNHQHQSEPFENQNILTTTQPPSLSRFSSDNHLSNVLPNNSLQNPSPNLTNNNFNSYFLTQEHQQPQHQQLQNLHHQQQQFQQTIPDGNFSHPHTNISNSNQVFPNNMSEMTQQYNINTQETTKHQIEQANYLQNHIVGDTNNSAHSIMMFGANNLHYQ